MLNNFKRGSGSLFVFLSNLFKFSVVSVSVSLCTGVVNWASRHITVHPSLRVDAVLVHHVAQVSLAGGQQVVGSGHEPIVLS